ncbi:MAG: ribonuclease III [Bacteroidales bacterium]|nr:ribonuclease III [Bacteroidales bacterium]
MKVNTLFGQENKKDLHNKKIKDFLKAVLGISPKNTELYNTALIHRSAADNSSVSGHSISNERLEYLGDAVLDTIAAEYLFKKFPFKPEGELTEMRSRMVCREQLGTLSRKIHLDELISINPHAHPKCAGGDAFEALVGAIFLDKGYEKTKKIVLQRLFFTYYDMDTMLFEESNFKSKILNWAQKNHKKISFEHSVEPNGRDRRLYRVQLLINNKSFAEGLDYTIKKAEQLAAEHACEKVEEKKKSM